MLSYLDGTVSAVANSECGRSQGNCAGSCRQPKLQLRDNQPSTRIQMTQTITLQLSDDLVSIAQAEAERSAKPLNVVLVQWIERGGGDDLERLSDQELLAVCDSTMDIHSHKNLSDLQARNREGDLSAPERMRMQELLDVYQRGLLRKAKALKIALGRGLRASLN